MKLTRTRTHLELRVGDHAAVDVVLHVRQADMAWFNQEDNKDVNNNNNNNNPNLVNHTTDLWQVLEQSVLPRMLHKQVEDAHYYGATTSKGSRGDAQRRPPPVLGRGGIPILAGEASGSSSSSSNTATTTKRGTKKGAKRKRAKAKETTTFEEEDEKETNKTKPEKQVYYAFGQTLQLAYRCEDVSKSNSASFTFRKDDDDDDNTNNSNNSNNESGILQELHKLPKRVVAWVFPFDPSQPTQVDPTNGGFPIPERIPIAHLFRGCGGGDGAQKK